MDMSVIFSEDVTEVGTETLPIRLSSPDVKTTWEKTILKKSKEKLKRAATNEEKIWSYETIPLLGQGFAIKEKLVESIPRILRWTTDMASAAEESGPDEDEEEQHVDGNMLVLSRVGNDQSFSGKPEGSSRSSEVKARLHRVKEDLASVKDVRKEGEDDTNIIKFVNREEEKKKKLEKEEQRERIAADIADMEEEVVYDTNHMLSTLDVAKLFGSTGDVDKVVKIVTLCLKSKNTMFDDEEAIYDAIPMVLKGYNAQKSGHIPKHPNVGEKKDDNIGLRVDVEENVGTNNVDEHDKEKVDEKPVAEEKDEQKEPVSTKIPKQVPGEKVKKVAKKVVQTKIVRRTVR
ncbi:hypothetical protein PanWU01x14_260220 [Parasponia andersonii]|uniref:Uncharacterized protein n=1 Tax=Parasponia andersonii TaxID=3476 RepID=A0A2P5B972_PARAD|nr:hypothetical protein PanWU01x14_260220 [Parasponia andersonii]